MSVCISKTVHHIAKIELTRLFGRYSYEIPRNGESLGDINILYGENGLGKTTLLTLVFHLLSPSRTRGHRTSISSTPFQNLIVTLNDGTQIIAEKDEQLLVGPVTFTIHSTAERSTWKYFPNSRPKISFEDLPDSVSLDELPESLRVDVQQAIEERKYFNQLSALQVTAFMLTSDRILLGDSVDLSERDRRPPSGDTAAGRRRLSELVSEQRTVAVSGALNSASAWLQRKFFERSYGAAESASRVYEKIVMRILNTRYKTKEGLSTSQQTKLKAEIKARIDVVNKKASEFGKFGLAPVGLSPSVVQAMQSAVGNKFHLIEQVVSPHIDEL